MRPRVFPAEDGREDGAVSASLETRRVFRAEDLKRVNEDFTCRLQ